MLCVNFIEISQTATEILGFNSFFFKTVTVRHVGFSMPAVAGSVYHGWIRVYVSPAGSGMMARALDSRFVLYIPGRSIVQVTR